MNNFEKSTKTRINTKDSEIVFSVHPKIYPKEVILKACYIIVDKVYVYIDAPKKDEFTISLKTKTRSTKKQLEALRGEFLNELLNASVRKEIAQKNKTIIEYIVGGAINAALPSSSKRPQEPSRANSDEDDIKKIEQEIEALKKELEQEDFSAGTYEEDPLNIKKPLQ